MEFVRLVRCDMTSFSHTMCHCQWLLFWWHHLGTFREDDSSHSMATHFCGHQIYAQGEPAALVPRKVTCFIDTYRPGFGLGSSKHLLFGDYHLRVVKIRLVSWVDVEEISDCTS